ncbi:hypothetical protein EIP91_011208 [Steccherinum ochraceum]|uniref:Tet-like 2OG-Fe(II) oxygenase domain-containing protein n=1 Tax=Steccherinum ochraceum TaxID=92696 RepID=A0A4R0R2F0_9APHY|nr:hypothetical protein EIP91_011208 [Steccherinum ochraceum]
MEWSAEAAARVEIDAIDLLGLQLEEALIVAPATETPGIDDPAEAHAGLKTLDGLNTDGPAEVHVGSGTSAPPSPDIEPGEIVEQHAVAIAQQSTTGQNDVEDLGLLKRKLSNKSRWERKKLKKIAVREEKARQQARDDQLRNEGATQILSTLYDGETVTVIRRKYDPALLAQLQDLERELNGPLDTSHPKFPIEKFHMLTKPGTYFIVDEDTEKLVLAVRITPWSTMTDVTKDYVQHNLHTVMDWSRCADPIKTNSSQNRIGGKSAKEKPNASRPGPGSSGLGSRDADQQVKLKSHGKGQAVSIKPNGHMWAVGWHASMEDDKTLVYYAGKDAKVELYETVISRLPAAATMFKEHFLSLFPGAARSMIRFAAERNIPSFADGELDGESSEMPFANCLTLTNNNFSNALHMDNDEAPLAYGMWWTTRVKKVNRANVYEFDEKVDHSSVKGGAFLLAAYGIGVDFERSGGLVEIFWRGKQDWHATTKSTSPSECTRWGTSVQLTKKGVAAVARFHKQGAERGALVNAHDRIETMHARKQTKK